MTPAQLLRYNRVPSSEKDEETGSEPGSETGLLSAIRKTPSSVRNTWGTRLLCGANIVLFFISAFMFFIGLRWQFGIDKKCFEATNFFTPATEEVDTTYQIVQYNGTVGWPSPYAPKDGLPTPEIDAAWEAFRARPMSVPEQVVLASGEDTNAVRLPEELGGGYLAWAEVNHQLHCLNLMRKAIYWDHYYPIEREFQRERFEVYAHLDHCVEMMRQILMCNADAGVQLHHWVKGNPTPIPNSNTWHKCKNFDSILDWTHKNQIPDWGDEHLPILPGSKIYDRQP